MTKRPKLAVTIIIVVILFAGGALAFSRSSVGTAMLRSRSHFIPSDANPQVLYEPGMEEPAALVASALPSAVIRVETRQHLPLAKPFRVYVCSSQESFNAYMGAPPGATARGVKVLNDIFLAPVGVLVLEGRHTRERVDPRAFTSPSLPASWSPQELVGHAGLVP